MGRKWIENEWQRKQKKENQTKSTTDRMENRNRHSQMDKPEWKSRFYLFLRSVDAGITHAHHFVEGELFVESLLLRSLFGLFLFALLHSKQSLLPMFPHLLFVF